MISWSDILNQSWVDWFHLLREIELTTCFYPYALPRETLHHEFDTIISQNLFFVGFVCKRYNTHI